ncbi:MAG: TRAP transporter large permease [Synergistales bacterium]|nr:TRAP transporter large permease [Synergistales bacterium]
MGLTITILILIFTIVIGVPVVFAFGASLIYMVVAMGYQSGALLSSGYSKLNTIVLLAIPLFILAGGIMERGNIGDALVGFINIFVGRIRGGLGAVAIIASALFGAISGSAAATLSCIGSIMFPKLREAGYSKGHAASVIVNASPLGLLIPPSSIQIIYAWSANQSVLTCFLATVGPGLLLAFLLCCVNWYICRTSPEMHEAYVNRQLEGSSKTSNWSKTKRAIPALLMPVIILGGIYGGIMTPTEAAAVSVLYAIPVGFLVYKGLTFKSFKDALVETGTTTGVLMVMFLIVMILSRLFVMENLPNKVIGLFMSVSEDPRAILIMVNLFMIMIGMLMDDVSGTLLCTPLLLPLMVKIGVSPIQFAAILGVNLGMGNITPPTAPLLYLGGRLGKASIREMLRPTMLMIIFAWMPTLIITTYVPAVSLALPSWFLGRALF